MDKRVYERLKGVVPAVLTPMDEEGNVDFKSLEKQTAYLSEAGVNGFFVGGTTAEGAYLTTEEKREIFRVVRRVATDEQFLCAAYIRPSTRAVLEEMETLKDTQPDYAVAVVPYYLSMRQEDIVAHYQALARKSTAPLILYDIPGNTHNPIAVETIPLLAEEDQVVGIKDSSGDFIKFSRGLLQGAGDDFRWIQGTDLLDAPSLMIGCDGIVTGLGNARIEPYVEMYAASQRGDWDAVLACQTRINRLHAIIRMCGNSISAVKAAAELSGRAGRWMRQKSQSLTDEQVREVAGIIEEYEEN